MESILTVPITASYSAYFTFGPLYEVVSGNHFFINILS